MAGTPNYIKFQRGTLTAYNNLSKKDNNTLYFVYANNDDSHGSLYLGSRLISANVGGSGVYSLSELSDVIVSEANTGDFLIKNSEGKWAAVSAETVAQTILELGSISNFNINENQFELNPVDNKLELKGFQQAAPGLIPIKSNNNQLSWTNLPPDLSNSVSNLEEEINNVKNDLAAVDGKIAAANHLKYTVVSDISEATQNNTVYLIPNNNESVNNQYDEFMMVNGALEKLGNFAPDLSQYATIEQLNQKANISQLQAVESQLNNYVTTTTFNATIGDLSKLSDYNELSNDDINIANTFEDIYERLVWQEIQA